MNHYFQLDYSYAQTCARGHSDDNIEEECLEAHGEDVLDHLSIGVADQRCLNDLFLYLSI